jgi:excisionase family DNA binding protein
VYLFVWRRKEFPMPEVQSASPRAKLLPIEGVMTQLSVGRSTVFHLIGTNQLRSVKVGRRRLVPQAAVDELVAHLMARAESEAGASGGDAA